MGQKTLQRVKLSENAADRGLAHAKPACRLQLIEGPMRRIERPCCLHSICPPAWPSGGLTVFLQPARLPADPALSGSGVGTQQVCPFPGDGE